MASSASISTLKNLKIRGESQYLSPNRAPSLVTGHINGMNQNQGSVSALIPATALQGHTISLSPTGANQVFTLPTAAQILYEYGVGIDSQVPKLVVGSQHLIHFNNRGTSPAYLASSNTGGDGSALILNNAAAVSSSYTGTVVPVGLSTPVYLEWLQVSPGSIGGNGATGLYTIYSAGVGNMGNTGATGGSISLAYGYAVGQAAGSAGNNAAIVFDLGGTVYPNANITPPSAGGTTFTITSTGIYQFDFYVAGTDAAGTTESLQIGLWINGAQASSPNAQGYIFQSAIGASGGATMTVNGSGIISLTAGMAVTLNNITNSGTTTITFTSPQSGTTTAGANRTFLLKRIA